VDFAEFVEKEYLNDPVRMVDAFDAEIAQAAADASVCWDSTRENIPIRHGEKVTTAKFVKSLNSNHHGRVYVKVAVYEYDFKRRKKTGVFSRGDAKEEIVKVPFPFLYFGNHSNSGICTRWSALEFLWEEYNKSRAGESVKKSKTSTDKLRAAEERKRRLAEEREKEQSEVSEKDLRWMKNLPKVTGECPYFAFKGATTLADQITVLTGETTKGNPCGQFYGVPVVDGHSGKVKGMQRYYPDPSGQKAEKRFRRSFDPSGCLRPFGMFLDGDPIYITEQIAGASLINRLTNMAAVSHLFIDNIVPVVSVLKERYPNSPIINVRDDDALKKYNAGVQGQKKLESTFQGPIVEHPAPFNESELEAGNSDLSDYWLIYGDEVTREFLLNI
jgi:hypothetical protein|tara:strand:+ start:57859 stop:59019 length:1161 start_codon:yes stop_codon:yes gene_type:complete